jgi:hypothetical protein
MRPDGVISTSSWRDVVTMAHVAQRMQRVVTKRQLDAPDRQDLAYWLEQPVEDRLAAVTELRRELFGTGADEAGPRLQRVCRVLRPQ